MRAIVCGAGGFIGGHLAVRLRELGYWVRGVDIKRHQFRDLPVDEFLLADLRKYENCVRAVRDADIIFQLAADMGGMGYIHTAECDIMRNSALINLNMIKAAIDTCIPKYFFSSSVCVYRDMLPGDPVMIEEQVYPAQPDNEYGWEKLYAERTAQAYARHYPIHIRIARFQNCYGPYGTWKGGREKAPAAICRKVIQAEEGGTVEVWGNGKAIRSYTYIDDLVDGIIELTNSDAQEPTNIGSDLQVTVDQLVDTIIDISGRTLYVKHIDGPVGVASRNFSKGRIKSLGWKTKTPLRKGLQITYNWINEQIKTSAGSR